MYHATQNFLLSFSTKNNKELDFREQMKTDHLQSVSSANLHVQPEYLIYQDFNFF